MSGGLEIRPIDSVDDARAASALIDRIWGEQRIITPELLRAMGTHGGQVFGAFEGGRIVGAQMAFVGLLDGQTVLHSHVTGIEPDAQHTGIGFAMKLAQRAWCLERGIETVTWTFDPMIARNAHFNLRKLGAVAVRFLRDFYGPMDDAFNAGERTDRLEVRWDVRSPRVEAAVAGRPGPAPEAAEPVLEERNGLPTRTEHLGASRLFVRIPEDYLAIRTEDSARARVWRDAVADTLEGALDAGYVATDFVPEHAYVLEQR